MGQVITNPSDPNWGLDPTDPSWGASSTETPPSAGTWEDRGMGGAVWHPTEPSGSNRTRADTAGAIGVDHTKIVQGIANWASKLPAPYQRSAAMLAAFPVDALASLVEMFSAPESVATLGAKPALAAMDATVATAGNTGRAVTKAGGVALDALDPDLVSIASPRGGAALKKIQQVRDVLRAKAEAAPPSPVVGKSPQQLLNEEALAARRATVAAPPASVPDAPAVPASPAVAPPLLETPARPQNLGNIAQAVKAKLTAAEAKEYLRLRARSMTDQEATEAIVAARDLAKKLGGATTDEVRKAIAHRNETGAW